MKKIKRHIYLLLLCLLPSLTWAQGGDGIRFVKAANWSEALALAKRENKPVFVDAYTTWCGPCRKMDLEIYTLPEVGQFFNEHFISVKIQMDSTQNDDAHTRSFWADAKKLTKQYKIAAFPSYLFFDPKGEIIHREMGYAQAAELIAIAKVALDPMVQYYNQVALYRKGKFDYAGLYQLEKNARKFKNSPLADSIALTLYNGHIKKLNKKELLTTENLDFIEGHLLSDFLNSREMIFKLALKSPAEIYAVKHIDTKYLVDHVISKEEIADKVWKKKVIINQNPDWNAYSKNIVAKYDYTAADSLVMNLKIKFLSDTKQDNLAALTRTELVAKYPPRNNWPAAFFALNVPAWNAFLTTDNLFVLNEALKWSEMSMTIGNSDQYIDTRANLLYKLGRKDEAVDMEVRALEFAIGEARKNGKPIAQEGAFKEYLETIHKMMKGQPTWPDKKP